jgi:hypothetical protein
VTISKKIAAQLQKRAQKQLFALEDVCFPEQLKFIQDTAKFKTAVTSRRSGKSTGCAFDLLYTALTLPGDVAYITLNRRTAKRIIWRQLLETCEKFNIDVHLDNTDLTITLPNKNVIYVSGAKDESDADKWRGVALRKVYIDEAQSFREYLKDFIQDVIEPTLIDYDGSLALIGTPGPIPAGLFYTASHSKGWSHHHWTMHNNPHIILKSNKDPELIIQETCQRRGVSKQDPSIQREFYGQWAKDIEALVFKFDPVKNLFSSLPAGKMVYIFGIDIGFNDSDAIAVLGYNYTEKKVYLVEEWIKNKQDITSLVDAIKNLQEKYQPVKMVMDAGALGKKIQSEIQQRHSLNIEAADKKRKFEFITLLNDDLRTGKLMAYEGSRFEEDCNLVEWDRNSSQLKISDSYHSDSCFIAGTLITTANGPKPIEHLNTNDLILTRSGYFPLEWTAKTGSNKEVMRLTFSSGVSIVCTGNHPIYTYNRGFIAAEDLTDLDRCANICEWDSINKNSALVLVTREILTKKEDVYNIKINGPHEYFANGILVHNCDAILYAWRECRHYQSEASQAPNHRDTLEYMLQLEDEFAKELAEAQRPKGLEASKEETEFLLKEDFD